MQATREDLKSLDQGVIQRKGPNIEALRQPLFAHVVFIDNIFYFIFGLFKVTVVYHSKVSIGTKTFLHIISFCLYLLSLYYKVSRNSWIVWNFNQHYDALGAMRHIPDYMNVREVKMVTQGGSDYITCSCGGWNRMRLPCSCMLSVVDKIDVTMCHVSWLKTYRNHYGTNTLVGRKLVEMQLKSRIHPGCLLTSPIGNC
jgi:hypothetical protein